MSFSSTNILGEEIHPLYRILLDSNLPVEYRTGLKSFLFRQFLPVIYRLKGMKASIPNGVQWNFHKFLVDKNGKPVAHFASEIEPLDLSIVSRIKQELDRKVYTENDA